MQAANDEEGGGGLVGQRTWGTQWTYGQGLDQVYIFMYLFRSIFQAGMLQMKSQSLSFA